MDGGRKWALTIRIFWASNIGATAVGVVTTIQGGDLMNVLQWWSLMMGSLLAIYGGLNVATKGA